jgi:hypothetical protein
MHLKARSRSKAEQRFHRYHAASAQGIEYFQLSGNPMRPERRRLIVTIPIRVSAVVDLVAISIAIGNTRLPIRAQLQSALFGGRRNLNEKDNHYRHKKRRHIMPPFSCRASRASVLDDEKASVITRLRRRIKQLLILKGLRIQRKISQISDL